MAFTMTAPPLTVQDYLAEPEGGPRWELIDGDPYVLRSPNEFHQRASVQLTVHFVLYLREHGEGEVFHAPFDVFLEEITAVQPDLLFVAHDNPNARIEGGLWGTPDLVVEILSPSNSSYDLVKKRRVYQKHQVRDIWFVDLDAKCVMVDRLGPSGYGDELVFNAEDILTTPILPGFELKVAEIFV